MAGTDVTRPSVLQRAAAGDHAEFAALYAPMVYAMARKRGLAEHDAEDVAQQTLLALLKRLPDFEYDRSRSFKGFIKTAVRNQVVTLFRRHRPATGEVEVTAESDDELDRLFEREWAKTHLTAALQRVRDEVEPTTFQAFQLTVVNEWPNAKVAEALGVTPNHVSQYKGRVLRRLREHLEDLDNGNA